jgi:hypothetical protein
VTAGLEIDLVPFYGRLASLRGPGFNQEKRLHA